MKQKTIIAILLCSCILITSYSAVADEAENEAEDKLDDVAYYDDGNVVHGDGVTFVDDKPEIDIDSISCDCTTESFIVTLTVKDNFPEGWAEGYEYSMTVFTSSGYGAISISYETDYYQTTPGGYASNLANPEFSVSGNSLTVTLPGMILDESTVNSYEAFAKLDTTDGALYIDWLPDPNEENNDDNENETDEKEDPSLVNNTTNNTGETNTSGDTENEESSNIPGFEIFFLLIATIGLIVFKKYKRKQ